MICLDTTFLVDLWRNKDAPAHPSMRLLREHPADVLAVPAHAAGEFLEGGACVSEQRLQESLRFLRLFTLGTVDVETAEHYGRIVADLRQRLLLSGTSKADMWIAAWATQHGAMLATRNTRHFEAVSGLRLLAY
jgi:predicted nucleic acid-binding protein